MNLWTDICPFNLHPWKWFEGYPVKSTLFFLGWQKHLRFSRAWHPFFFWFTLWNPAFSQVATLENLRCFCHPEKNRADFTGYPPNHFSGCRLNRRVSANICFCLIFFFLSFKELMIGLIFIDSQTGSDKFWYFLRFQIIMFETLKQMKSDKKQVFADIVYLI